MLSGKKLYKYLVLALASYMLFPLSWVFAGSMTLAMELGYDKSRLQDKSISGTDIIRSRFQQTYIVLNRGSVVHPRILPYSINFTYGRGDITDLDRSYNIVDKSFSLTTTVLPMLRFPVGFTYKHSDTKNDDGDGTVSISDTVGVRWNLGFKKFPRTSLFYNYNITNNDDRKRDNSDYGFTLSKAAGKNLKYGRTVYVFSYKGKGSGISRSVNSSDSRKGQLTNSVAFSSGTSFSKRSNFNQSLQYEIRESVEQQSSADFGQRDSNGSKVIRYSGGLNLATNPYLKQNYAVGYSFDSGVGRPDSLLASFSGKIDKVVSSRLNLVSSALVTKSSTYLSSGAGQASSEGVRMSGGARWTISRRLSSNYNLFFRNAKNTANILSGERESKAFGVNGNLGYKQRFRLGSLKAGLGGSLSDDTTDGRNSKVISSSASTSVSSKALKFANLSGNYGLTNGKNVDLRPGGASAPVAVISVIRTQSYGGSVSNIWFKKYISLDGKYSFSEDKSDSRTAGSTESYSGNASISYVKSMTIRGTYSNTRRLSGILVDTRSETYGGNFGYVTSIFRGPLSFKFEYSAGRDDGGGSPLKRERKHYIVGYGRRLTRFMAMSASYFRDETTETNVDDRIEDFAKLFLSYRLGAWKLSFEWSWSAIQATRDTEEIRYVSVLSRQISRRF